MQPNVAARSRAQPRAFRRPKSKLIIISIIVIAFIFLNALPWWIRYRVQQQEHRKNSDGSDGRVPDTKKIRAAQSVDDEDGRQHQVRVLNEKKNEDSDAFTVESPPTTAGGGGGIMSSVKPNKALNHDGSGRGGAKKKKAIGKEEKKEKKSHRRGKGKRKGKGDDVEEPEVDKGASERGASEAAAEEEKEWLGEDSGDTDLLDSLTAQQLLDGGYTYRSYEEVDGGPEGEGSDNKEREGGGEKEQRRGFQKITAEEPAPVVAAGKSGQKKKAQSSSSRSIATHTFRTAKKYNPNRPDRVCAQLLPNVSLDALRKETNRIGTFQEYWYTGDIEISPEEAVESEEKAVAVMAMRTRRPTADQLRNGRGGNGNERDEDETAIADGEADEDDGNNEKKSKLIPLSGEKEPVVKYAYVLMISNHKYVDGALVVAQSLRQHSEMVKKGEADLVLIISEKIKMTSVRLLTRVFTRVKIMYSMSTYAPNSYYKTTFDKIYLFWLTEYKVVLFMDADSLVTGNPDGLILDKEFEGDPEHNAKRFRRGKKIKKTPLTAVGGGDYFQTGLLIAKPDRQLFTDLFLEFRLGAFGYNQWRARDGVLIRTCFMEPHTNIEHPLDRLYHFYGFVKPWFNKDSDYKYGKGDDRLTFSPNYWDWWRRYEELHERYFVTIAAVEQQREEKRSAESDTFSKYVYGWSANYPEKDVPIPGLPYEHPYTGESVAHKKPKGGWSKFDALKVAKSDFPNFFSNTSIFDADKSLLAGQGAAAKSISTANSPQLVMSLVDPKEYMWIQRFSVGAEYFRPTFRKYAAIFNASIEAVSRRFLDGDGLSSSSGRKKEQGGVPPLLQKGPSIANMASVVIGEPGDSCTETCRKLKTTAATIHAASSPHGLCVEEALKATTVNDCFFGFEKDFSPLNNSVIMPHTGHHCDVCTYEYKSEAAPYILPTTQEIIERSAQKETEKERKKKLKERRRREKEAAKKAAVMEKDVAVAGTRAHKQAVLEEDEDDEAIRRRFTLAEAVKDGKRLNECRVNFLHEKLLFPTCDARKDGAARVCVCV